MAKGNKTNHPKKYVHWKDWEAWLLKEWYPFKNNDWVHMRIDVAGLKSDMVWLKLLSAGIILAIIGGAIAIILTR